MKNGRRRMWWYLVIAIVAAPVVGLALLSLLARRPNNLGVKDGRLSDCPSTPNCVCSIASDAGHAIAPLRYSGSAAEAMQRLKGVLSAMPRATIVESTERYLHAEFRTAVFRFVDDAEFLLDPAAHLIQVRSAARSGKYDFGANRARVEEIRRRFDDAPR